MVQVLFPDGDGTFQDDNAPIHTARVAKNWYEEHESELEYMSGYRNLKVSILSVLKLMDTSSEDRTRGMINTTSKVLEGIN